jgi:hypothetical protein
MTRSSPTHDPEQRSGLTRRQFLKVSGAGALSLCAAGHLAGACGNPASAPPDAGPPDTGSTDGGVDPVQPVDWELQHARHRREAIEDELSGWPRLVSAAAPVTPPPPLDYQLCERGCAASLHAHDY